MTQPRVACSRQKVVQKSKLQQLLTVLITICLCFLFPYFGQFGNKNITIINIIHHWHVQANVIL